MNCQHFTTCGSCTITDQNYSAELIEKQDRVIELLKPFSVNELTVFSADDAHYRARAEFRIWHNDEGAHYAMSRLDRKGTVIIMECPKVIQAIEQRMAPLLKAINASETLKHKLFAVEFLATTSNECLITLIYHRPLDDIWQGEAKELEHKLDAFVMGRSRKQKVILSQEYVTEKLTIDETLYAYRHYESGFTQPNPAVNIKMIEWAIAQAKKVDGGDFLESYCGLGNFSIPISKYFDRVLATEISKRSIHAALENCSLNNINNIAFIRLSSEEMTEALNKSRVFRRLKEIDLESYNFSTVLVDPPRAGLDKGTTDLIAKIENIIYISCNPETLARDLETLTRTHEIQDAAIFDQFPHTHHIESGVFLVKRNVN